MAGTSSHCLEAKKRMSTANLPPPPPPLPMTSIKPQAPCPPPPPLPPGAYVARSLSALEKQKKIMAMSPSSESMDWSPTVFFFYGSLMDREVLQTVLGLPVAPDVGKGYITGFKVKMWGIYPALVPNENNDGSKVTGTFWTVDHKDSETRLSNYETRAYKTTKVTIAESDGKATYEGRTFCWAGDIDSPDLEDGTFDFERYQQNFKPSMRDEWLIAFESAPRDQRVDEGT